MDANKVDDEVGTDVAWKEAGWAAIHTAENPHAEEGNA
jgi:hypothetical protein